MKTVNLKILVWGLISISFINAYCQAESIQPHIGYLYPAGGQRGHDVLITAGGQFLQKPEAVYISGDGVHATVVKYYRPTRNLQKEQRELIINRLQEVRDKRIAELPASVRAAMSPLPRNVPKQRRNPNQSKENEKGQEKKETPPTNVKMPEHPLLYDLENKSLRQLAHITKMLFIPRSKLQQNRQLSEAVLLKITIDPEAKPGPRELRIKSAAGLTNPMIIQIGQMAEYAEMEPNDEEAYPTKFPRQPELPKEKSLELPVVLNGQIMPDDVDRFRFRAKAGQQLVIETQARSLIPYLADAVPGWFQATVTLYDADNNEVAYADDYRFNPDPVLYYKIPKTGDYELLVRDSVYRGRDDFVYRISIGELPFIRQMFPLGGKEGDKSVAAVEGWNLPVTQLSLDTQSGGKTIRQTRYEKEGIVSNFVPYAVDTLPECNESEPGENVKSAQPVKLPIIINGQISPADDLDVYQFQGKSGDEITAEVYARRLNSPLDSLLRLTDASGKILEWNDDYVLKDTAFLFKDCEGLLTHHADSYLKTKLPADGTYYVQIADSAKHGGAAYGYRLRLTTQTPDFELRVTPSSLSPRPGEVVPVTVYVLRKDGFDGPIEVSVKNTPPGFKLEGGHIPPGCEHIRMTLKAPQKALDKPVALEIEGRAMVGEKTILRRAVPAEDMMQAFLYRHLVPSQELLVAMRKARRPVPVVELMTSSPIAIPASGSVRVRLKSNAPRWFIEPLQLELQDAPEGVSLHDVTVVPEGLVFTLKADSTVQEGLADNLIIETTRELAPPGGKNTKATNNKRQQSVGIIPAIPIRITANLSK